MTLLPHFYMHHYANVLQLEGPPANGEANGMENGNHSVKQTSFKNYEAEPSELHHMLPGR
jgi:hypothetical protein